MTNAIQVFQNEDFGQVRTAGTPDNPLFCLVDVCKALDLQAKHVIERLDKGVVSTGPLPTAGGIQQANFVNEDGLYDVILDSRKPEAKRFRKWITSEVIPSIRKTGRYELPQLAPHPRYRARLIGTAIKDIGVTSRMLQEVFHVREGLALSKATVLIEQTYEIDLSAVKELLPPAEHDVGSLTPTQLAKMIGDTTNRAVNKALVALGFQIKTEKGYELTDAGKEYGEMVPFTSKNSKHTGYQPKWNTKVIAEIKNVTI